MNVTDGLQNPIKVTLIDSGVKLLESKRKKNSFNMHK